MDWTIWTVKPCTGDKADCIARYSNKGHAIARLRGLRRAAWLAGSEMQYALQREG
jgi:hypothetical protein